VINLILIIFSTLNLSLAADDHCAYFKYCGSASSGTQSSSKSTPSTSLASAFNPSNISKIKGVGLETLFQLNNPLGFNVVTGTGKFGGALISPSVENSFFGNRSIEIDQVYMQRREDGKRFKNKKISLAIGANLLTTKNTSFDLGIAGKYNPETKGFNPGAGLSASLGFLNLGYSYYKDDAHLNLAGYYNLDNGMLYTDQFNSQTYEEKFHVQTYSIGVKLGNWALDYGKIKTHYNFYYTSTFSNGDVNINILSTAYNIGDTLLNLGYRTEDTPMRGEVDGTFTAQGTKHYIYLGAQYMINKHVLLGAGYNLFLLNELSCTLTLYL
jgi:hypothetical protein